MSHQNHLCPKFVVFGGAALSCDGKQMPAFADGKQMPTFGDCAQGSVLKGDRPPGSLELHI